MEQGYKGGGNLLVLHRTTPLNKTTGLPTLSSRRFSEYVFPDQIFR